MGIPETSRSEEHTSELQSLRHLVCRLLLEKKTASRCGGWDGGRPPRCPLIALHAWCRCRLIDINAGCRLQTAPKGAYSLACPIFFNDTATTEIYTLSLHDALPISRLCSSWLGHSSSPIPGERREDRL